MSVKDNIKEGLRRIWIICALLLDVFILFKLYHAAYDRNIDILPLLLIGLIIAAPLAGIIIYHTGWFFGWKLFEWVYDGFTNKAKE